MRLSKRYREEFGRYRGGNEDSSQGQSGAAEMGMPGDAARMASLLNGL